MTQNTSYSIPLFVPVKGILEDIAGGVENVKSTVEMKEVTHGLQMLCHTM